MTQGRNNLGWILPVFLPSAIALSVLMVFAPQPLAVLVIPGVIVAILFFIAHSAAGLYLLVLALPFQRLEVILAGQIGVSPVDLIIWPWLLAYGAQALTRGIHKTKLLLFVAIWLLSTLISGIVATNSRAFLVALGSTTIYAMFLVAAYDQLRDARRSCVRLPISTSAWHCSSRYSVACNWSASCPTHCRFPISAC
ncbi:MAG: hypothetical protein IPP62_17830 [bacterium]|nr:hypothetical protein [bacterium]